VHAWDRLYFSIFSMNADRESFFEEDDFQDFEFDGEINQLLDATDFNETSDYLWDEDSLKGFLRYWADQFKSPIARSRPPRHR